MMKKNLKRWRNISLGVVLMLLLATLGGSWYLLDFALKTEVGTEKYATSEQYLHKHYPQMDDWLDSLKQTHAMVDTFVTSPDGVKLHAMMLPSVKPTQKTAVIVHGYTDNALRMLMIGYLYQHSLGYNILLPDLRFAGQSGGTHIQMGWNDRLDVLRWMAVANQVFGGNTQMVVHGISMGAATTMMVSGEPQQPYVKAFVEDCGYTSVWDEYSKEIKAMGLPQFPLLNVASVLCDVRYGWNFKQASAVKQVAKCHLPMLFIHGDNDTYVPTWMVHELYKAKPQPKELWVAPGSKHALSYADHPEAYTQRVAEFLRHYIK